MNKLFFLGVMLLAFLATNAMAGVPQLMNYQGRLTSDMGDPLDTTVSITFTIYDDSTGPTVKWSEVHPDVPVSDGMFNVVLGTYLPIDDGVFIDSVRYLGIQVGGDPEIHPRTRLLSVGYSHRVSTVDGASGGVILGNVSIQGDLSAAGKATIGPGHVNTGANAFVAGANNSATGDYSVVAGGGGADISESNAALGLKASIGGGSHNIANATYCNVGGGSHNIADGTHCSVGGGYDNASTGNCCSTVGGGSGNTASGAVSTISGGGQNIASANYATIPGGLYNSATGEFSFAAGKEATASHDGSFVWNDNDDNPASSNRNNQFKVAADGGVQFELNEDTVHNETLTFDFRFRLSTFPYDYNQVLACSNGAKLTTGGAWTDASDRNLKENFTELDRTELLESIASLPITRWNYKMEGNACTHIGPVAQDFHAVFDVGDDKGIAAMDQAGIALAAIQELYRQNQEQKKEIAELKTLVEKLLDQSR
ncbi:MAG: tail fiber domain-containing protein [Planctomycetota bacterium]|nr:MAG: tail fiber domain-containing protein [Planctomycetota bacterium]